MKAFVAAAAMLVLGGLAMSEAQASCYKTCTGHGIYRSCRQLCHDVFSTMPNYETGYNPSTHKTPGQPLSGEYNQVLPYSYELDEAAVSDNPQLKMGNDPKGYENRMRRFNGNAWDYNVGK